jgi:hypothetical protein
LKILLDDDAQPIEMAFMHRQWARVGYTHRARKATFRGVAFPRAAEGVHWQLNPVYREMQFSPMAMTETLLPEYWRRLVDFSPEYLHGYPSAISLLARWVIRHGLRGQGPRIRAALLGSEGCTPDQREVIEDAFQTRVFTWYGHSERLVLGGECEHSSDYHQFPDYGWLEILDEQGREVASASGRDRGHGLPEPRDAADPLSDRRLRHAPRAAVRLRTQLGPVQRRRRPPEAGDDRGPGRRAAVAGGAQHPRPAVRTGGALPVLPGHARSVRDPRRPDPDFTEADRQAIAAAYARKLGNAADLTVRVVDSIPLTHACGHRLEHRDAQRLAPGRQYVGIGLPELIRDGLRTDAAQQLDSICDPRLLD